jgi:hypothetical protein
MCAAITRQRRDDAALAADEGLAGLQLPVEGVEFLLKALSRRFTGVDGATDSCAGRPSDGLSFCDSRLLEVERWLGIDRLLLDIGGGAIAER